MKFFEKFFFLFLILLALTATSFKGSVNAANYWYCRSGLINCQGPYPNVMSFRSDYCSVNPACSVMGPYNSWADCKALATSCPY